MSTLRVDKIKGRTGTTVTIPDSQNLAVTGNVTVSGQQNFASGAQLNLQGENINSGTRGQILYYDTNGEIAKLALGATGAVLQSDGTDVTWGNIAGSTSVYYVSPAGTDAAGRGGSIDAAFKTVKYACGAIGTPTATQPAVIYVKGGTYEEVQLPIVVPQYTTIAGDSLRATIIKPKSGQTDSGGTTLNVNSTLFRLSNATIIQDLVLDGMTGYTAGSPAYAPENATVKGTYFALNSASAITDKSPYIYNVTSFGDGATGAVVDGSLHATGNKTMLFHTYTCIHNDGLGIWCHSNGAAELISVFTYFNQVGIAGTSGAEIRVLNSSNSYGEYGVYSAGYDATETTNNGVAKGSMLTYTNVLTTEFTLGEQITGSNSTATAYVANVQSEPKVVYIVGKSGSFQANETVTGSTSGATATLAAASFDTNSTGRVLVTTFGTSPSPGDSLEFGSTDGNAYQIQTVSSVTANSVDYHILITATSRPTPIPDSTVAKTRKRFSLVRLTGHDFAKVGTGDKTTTNWPGEPTQPADQADQIITNSTDPGRVYHVSTDEDGNFYVGDYFKVDQATGNVTLDASAFNLKGLQTLQLGAIGGLIGATINEFSTDTTLSQNSDSKVPTQAAIRAFVASQITAQDVDFSADSGTGAVDLDSQVFVINGTANEVNTSASNNTLTIGLPQDVTIGQDLTVTRNAVITGNLTVNGTTVTNATTNTTITDNLIELNSGAGSNANDCGILIERGSTGDNAIIAWDESADKFVVGTTTATNTDTGNLTIAAADLQAANITAGNTSVTRLITGEVIEKVNIDSGAGPSGTLGVDLATNAVHYYSGNAAGDWTFNFRGDGSTTLASMMATGESITVGQVVTNGGTAYKITGLQIDGTNLWSNVNWAGGAAPSAGNASSKDVYSFTFIRTGSCASDWVILGSLTNYKA